MKYISRHIWYNKAGVVDTDTGREIVFNSSDLVNSAGELGMNVKGMSYYFSNGMYEFIPYQPPETLSQLQIKMQMLHKVQVVTYDGAITHLHWNPEEITVPVEVRVLDFATKIGDCIFQCVHDAHRHVVTLVLEDGLQLGQNSFCTPNMFEDIGVDSLGVKIDMSRVKDTRLAADIYWQLLINPFVAVEALQSGVLHSVIDDNGRKIGMVHDIKNFIGDNFDYDSYHNSWLDHVSGRVD